MEACTFLACLCLVDLNRRSNLLIAFISSSLLPCYGAALAPGIRDWSSSALEDARPRGVGARRGLVVVVVGAACAGAGGARRTGLPSAAASLELHGW